MKFLFAAVATLALVLSVLAEEQCPSNEVFSKCGTGCPEHCLTRNPKTGKLENGLMLGCDKMCHRGCFCPHGSVRDLTRNGTCVLKSACPPVPLMSTFANDSPTCGMNEVYTTCGSVCPEHCPTKNPKTGKLETNNHIICPDMCKVGCVCAHGFVRDLQRNNVCVEKALCSAP